MRPHSASDMYLFMLFALLAADGILADETDHEKEIRKIETGIDQLIYRIIKLENGIDARRAPDKVRGYKSLSSRVSKVVGKQRTMMSNYILSVINIFQHNFVTSRLENLERTRGFEGSMNLGYDSVYRTL